MKNLQFALLFFICTVSLTLLSCGTQEPSEILSTEAFIDTTVTVNCIKQQNPQGKKEIQEKALKELAQKYKMEPQDFSIKYIKSMSYLGNKEVMEKIKADLEAKGCT